MKKKRKKFTTFHQKIASFVLFYFDVQEYAPKVFLRTNLSLFEFFNLKEIKYRNENGL